MSSVRRQYRLVWLVVLVVLSVAPAGWSQVITGEIDGNVTDPSGALVPGATVTITDLSTKQVARRLKSDEHGVYTASLLAVGDYTISAEAPGFEKTEIAKVTVNVGDAVTTNIRLKAGSDNETVTVEASSAAPNTETPENSAVINESQMKELELNTRNFEQILTIQPGVSYTGPDQLSSGLINAQGAANPASLSVNGLQPTQLSFNFDGADTLDKITIAQSVLFPSIDAINQIKVLRDSYGAQYGGGGSAQVLIVSKAGGSTFHGDAYFFFRNQYLNANNFANLITNPELPRPPIRYNDFGFTLGGPLYIPHLVPKGSSKTYFFYSEELRRIQTNPTQNIANYPTLAEANGYFPAPVCVPSGTAGAVATINGVSACTTANQTGFVTPAVANSPFPGNPYQVPASAFNPVSVEYLKDLILPAEGIQQPNSALTASSVELNEKSTQNSNQILARIDHQFNSRLSGFFRYIIDPYHQVVPDGYNETDGFPGVNTENVYTYGENFLGHGTFTLTPNTVLDFGYSYLPYEIKTQVIGFAAAANSPDVQVTLPYANTTGRVPTLNIGGGSWGPAGPVRTLNHTQQMFENTTKQLGRHTLQFGFNFEHYYATTNQGTLNSGQFLFSSNGVPYTAANATKAGVPATLPYTQSFAQFLTGTVGSFTQESIDPVSHISSNLTEAYIQDGWRVRPHLTLQAGMRWSVYGQPYDRDGHLGAFEPTAYNKAQAPAFNTSSKSDGYECLPGTTDTNCAGVASNPNYNPLNGIVQGGVNSPYGQALSRRSFTNFAPRVGFAYDVFGNGKTSFRGGFGIFYNQIANTIAEQQVQGNPAYVKTVTFNATSFASPGAGVSPTAIPLTVSGASPNWTTPYTESYSLDIQQQMDPTTVVTFAYVGNKTFHLQGVVDANQPLPGEYSATTGNGIVANTAAGAAMLNPVRPYLGYETINYFDTRFFADYNGLQVGLIKSFAKARGAHLVVNYTWSKALANSRGFSSAPQNTYDLSTEYGPTSSDRREIFNTALAYTLPFYREMKGFKGKALGGYEVAAIIQAVSGTWLTPTFTQSDPAGQGWQFGISDSVTRPDQNGNPNLHAPHTPGGEYFNAGKPATDPPPAGTVPLTASGTLATYSLVPTGEYRPGDARVGTILGPGYQVWNLAVYKNFDLPEQFRFQFRVEGFNAFNHVNPSTVNAAYNNTDFGEVTAYRDNRQLQLGAKLYF
jgi:hypothetical protein